MGVRNLDKFMDKMSGFFIGPKRSDRGKNAYRLNDIQVVIRIDLAGSPGI